MIVDMLLDMQFGSTGKGLFSGCLTKYMRYEVAISCNMPNAGHTFVGNDGRKIICKVLPTAAVATSVDTVMIGPGSVFSIDRLMVERSEMLKFRGGEPFNVVIHPNAVVLNDEHAEWERDNMSGIASTMQGSAAAVMAKMMRVPDGKVLAKDYRDRLDGMVVSHGLWRNMLDASCRGILECSQGYSLGIDTEFYPYTTSRNCNVASFMNAGGVPAWAVSKIYGTMRTYPIRVGNLPEGHSGDCYPDQEETSWQALGLEPERTTVTNRIRRVFTFSMMQLRDAVWDLNPDHMFLNFGNYLKPKELSTLVTAINAMCENMESHATVDWIGLGPKESDVYVVNDKNLSIIFQ